MTDHKSEPHNSSYFLDTLVEHFLAVLSPDCPQIYWSNPDDDFKSCSFLITQFLEYYGTRLFPCLNLQVFESKPIFSKGTDRLSSLSNHNDDNVDSDWEKATILPLNGSDIVSQLGIDVLARCQSTILTWLLRHITVNSNGANKAEDKKNNILSVTCAAAKADEDVSFEQGQLSGNEGANGEIIHRSEVSDSAGSSDSCPDVRENPSGCGPRGLPNSNSAASSMGSASLSDRLLLRALTSNRDMVSAIHTMLRHAYYLPSSHLATVAAVTRTYREWLRKAAALVAHRRSHLNQSDDDEKINEYDPQSVTFEENRWTGGLPFDSLVSVFLSSSAAAFSQMGSHGNVGDSEQPPLSNYYEVAMYILATCHDLVVFHSSTMSREGWELLLNTLLGFIDCRLPLDNNADDSDKRIVRYLIQTLLVTLVRASLFVPIPTELWDRASLKLSQLAANQDVLAEWIKCVRKMTELFSVQALDVNWRSAVSAAMASERTHNIRAVRSVYRVNRHPSSTVGSQLYPSQASSAGGRRFADRRSQNVSATAVKRPHALPYAPLISPPLVSSGNDRHDGAIYNDIDRKGKVSQRVPSYIVVPNKKNSRLNDYLANVRSEDDVSFTLPYAAGSALHQRLRSLSGTSSQALSSILSLPRKSPISPNVVQTNHLAHSASSNKIDEIRLEKSIMDEGSPPSSAEPLQQFVLPKSITQLSNNSNLASKKSQSLGDLEHINKRYVLNNRMPTSARQSASQEELNHQDSATRQTEVISPSNVNVSMENEGFYNSAPGTERSDVGSNTLRILPSSPDIADGSIAADTTGTSFGDRETVDSRPGSGLVMVDRAASSLGFCGPEDSNSNVLSSERDSFSLHLPQDIPKQQSVCDGDISKPLGSDNSIIHTEELECTGSDKEQDSDVNFVPNGVAENSFISRPVLAGGNRLGWSPTSAYAIWRRLLGIIGNPNVSLKEDPQAHLTVIRFLSDIARGLIACREAQSLVAVIRPDIFIFAPLLFESLQVLDETDFVQSNVIAIDVLSRILCLQHDPELPPSADFVTSYYFLIHQFICKQNRPVVSALVHAMNIRFFASNLPGKLLLFADLSKACQIIVEGFLEQSGTSSNASNDAESLKLESAISLMGSLLCFTRSHGPEMTCLNPESDELQEKSISCLQVSDELISTILKLMDKPIFYGVPRLGQLVVCTLALFLSHECENICNQTNTENSSASKEESNFDQAFRQLSSIIRYVPHAVDREGALDVCESAVMSFLHLSNYAQKVITTHHGEELVRSLILDLSTILYWLCHHAESCTREAEIRLGCYMTYCLIEWSLAIPLNFLLQTVKFPSGPHALVYKVFKGLTVAATKGSHYPGAAKSATLNEVSNGTLRPESSADGSTTLTSGTLHGPSSKPDTVSGSLKGSQAPSILQMAARWALAYLLQHLGLYPYSTSNTIDSHSKDTSFTHMQDAENETVPVQFIALQGQAIISVFGDEDVHSNQSELFGVSSQEWNMSEKGMTFSVRDISGNYSWNSRLVCGHKSTCTENHNWVPGATCWRQLVSITADKFVGSVDPVANNEENSTDDAPLRFLNILNEVKTAIEEQHNEEATQQLQTSSEVNCDVEEAVSHCAEMEDRFMREEWSQSSIFAPDAANPSDQLLNIGKATNQPLCVLTRLFMESLGWLTAGHGGSDIVHLKSSESFFRDLRHLDHLKSDTHKVAVAYVARDQEDSTSVLSNSRGSPEYETFVRGLGWNVPVNSHQGFLGGIARDGSYGSQIPYFCSATAEMAFHVASMIAPGQSAEETVRKRTKHLGNDEVQVVWSEHWRRYNRDIIPGDFGDVIIIIRPLPDIGMFQVYIERKRGYTFLNDSPHFVIGPPLYNGAVLDAATLAAAVRSAAMGASRSLAFARPHYRYCFSSSGCVVHYLIFFFCFC